jgi:hypothetical protein
MRSTTSSIIRNLGPFVGKLLIQHLVKSNPSPAYISRVAAAFSPVPVTVVENSPSGKGLILTPVTTGAEGGGEACGLSVTVAEADPPGPLAATLPVPDGGKS